MIPVSSSWAARCFSAGESLQVDGMLAVSHVVPDAVLDEITHRQTFFRPEEPLPIHCRITASA